MAVQKSEKSWTLERIYPWLLLVGGGIVVLASLALSIERIDSLQSPSYRPVCNLNPIFSCSSVSSSAQAHIVGFYNPLLGLIGYSVLATIGVAMLAGARFKKWFWRAVQAGVTFAFLFMTWLQFQALYRIGALCLFCMVLWAMTGPLFWYTTLYNLRSGHAPKQITNKFPRAIAFAQRHHGDILLLWFLIIIALILKRFWYYWSTLA